MLLLWGINFFGQNQPRKHFPDPLFACVIPEILLRKHILSTNTLYVMQPYKQLTENISKRDTQQAGGDFLS